MKTWNENMLEIAIGQWLTSSNRDVRTTSIDAFKSPHFKDCINKYLWSKWFPQMNLDSWKDTVDKNFDDSVYYSELQDFAYKLLDAWLQILWPKRSNKQTWITFTDWTNIWYVQAEYSWYAYSLNCIPSRNTWNWFRVIDNAWLTIAEAKQCLASRHLSNTFVYDYNPEYYSSIESYIETSRRRSWKNYGYIHRDEVKQFIK